MNEEKLVEKNELVNTERIEFGILIEKIIDFIKENYPLLSAVIVAFVSGCFWVVKALWYSYNSGMFSIYKIDNDYIDMNNENFILQILNYVVIGGVFLLVNWYYYKMFSKKCKISTLLINVFCFYVIEGLIVSIAFLILTTDITIKYIWEIMRSKDWYVLLIILFVFCVFFNLLGTFFLVDSKISQKKAKKKKEMTIKGYMFKMLKFLVLFVIIEFIMFYTYGICEARMKVDYKVMIEEKQHNEEGKYIFSISGNSVEIFPVIYENEDIYILSKLYKSDDKVVIDYNYQKIVEKEAQETYYVRNINYIKYDK